MFFFVDDDCFREFLSVQKMCVWCEGDLRRLSDDAQLFLHGAWWCVGRTCSKFHVQLVFCK